jgi:hypothetical protein
LIYIYINILYIYIYLHIYIGDDVLLPRKISLSDEQVIGEDLSAISLKRQKSAVFATYKGLYTYTYIYIYKYIYIIVID